MDANIIDSKHNKYYMENINDIKNEQIKKCKRCNMKLIYDKKFLIIIPDCIKHGTGFEYVPSKNILCILCKKCESPRAINIEKKNNTKKNFAKFKQNSLYNLGNKDDIEYTDSRDKIIGRIYSNKKWKNYYVFQNEIYYYTLKDVKVNNYIIYFIVAKINKISYIIHVSNFLTDKDKKKIDLQQKCLIS